MSSNALAHRNRLAYARWLALVALTRAPSALAQTPPQETEPPVPPTSVPAAPSATEPSPADPPPPPAEEPAPPSAEEPPPPPSTAPPSPPAEEPAPPPSAAPPPPSAPVPVQVSGEEAPEPLPPSAEEPVSNDLQAVVVTAQRREETVQSVPTPVSVLGGETLTDLGIGRSAKEVLDYVPNASAVTQGHGRPRWWIRGVGTGQQQMDFSNPVGFYLDDVYISNATATGFPIFDVDRVEVLRGPQGTLWGKNTTGGAINLISRKPDFSYDGFLKADYGSYRDKVFQGAFGGPIWDDKIAARGAFYYEDFGGRFRNLYTKQRDGQLTDGAGRLQLLWKITPKIQALANVHFRKYTNQGQTTTVTGTGEGGVYTAGYVPSKNWDEVSSNAPSHGETSQTGALLNISAELGDFTLTSITGWESFRSSSLSDSDNTPLEISRGWDNAVSRQLSEELRIASPKSDRINWIAGVYAITETINREAASARLPGVDQALPGPGGVPGPGSYNYSIFEHDSRSFAAFASATVDITNAFSVSGGVRWTLEHRSLDLDRVESSNATFSNIGQWWKPNSVSSALTQNIDAQPEKTWRNWTGDITPQYKITKDILVYLRYAHGVKSGGFNTAANRPEALNVVEPETLDDFEAGAKTAFFGNRLIVNATAFHYLYKDIQINVVGPLPPTNVATSYLQNVEEGRADGAEFEVEVHPIPELHITGNIGLLDTEFTKFVVSNTDTDNSGNRFVRSPTFTSFLRVQGEIPLPLGNRPPTLIPTLDWRYTSKQVHFTTNQDDPLLGTKAFSMVNAQLSLASNDEKLLLTGWVKNLLDVEYISHSLPAAAGATGAVTMASDPRTFGVSLTSRWY